LTAGNRALRPLRGDSVAEVATDPMPAEQTAALAEFARACKAAARAVSLYPGTHPAIGVALDRVMAAASRLITASPVRLKPDTTSGVTIGVRPDLLVVDGCVPAKPDQAVIELAALLHERQVGALRIEQDADGEDWRSLLLVIGRAAEDLIAEGGIGAAWRATGRSHFEIREIDYAEVLRERAGGHGAGWDRILLHCLTGQASSLDERAIASLLDAVSDRDRFEQMLDRLQTLAPREGATLGARAAALIQLLRSAVEETRRRGGDANRVLQTAADGAAHLTPDMVLALIGYRQAAAPEDAQIISGVLDRMTDAGVATFVARSVASERGATERLAQAFEALVPERERKERLLDLAHDEAAQTELGQEEQFERLWEAAASMLRSYSDTNYVSAEYARELSQSRTQAIEVERVSDDPPERVQAWLSTMSNESVRQLDEALLLDLLLIEDEPARWQALAAVVVTEVERRTLLGDAGSADRLAHGLMRDATPAGREALRDAATAAMERLSSGPLVRHLVLHLRTVEDADVDAFSALAQTVGPGLAQPLAEALAVEDHSRAIRRLREILLSFGAAGRQSVEQLKSSSNPAVRRTAIDLLRVFGGREALPELASMLNDSDPQVQRESIRAIVQIGTHEAFAVLQQALVAGGRSRETMVQQLIGLHDDKAIPLLCYVLNGTQPRGTLAAVHAEIVEALGGLSAHPESTRTLKTVLYRGSWWAPLRTAALRHAAATALRRIGSPESVAVLQEAAASGPRGVRKAARTQAGLAASATRVGPRATREPDAGVGQERP
jgi:HEAT repeat protein